MFCVNVTNNSMLTARRNIGDLKRTKNICFLCNHVKFIFYKNLMTKSCTFGSDRSPKCHVTGFVFVCKQFNVYLFQSPRNCNSELTKIFISLVRIGMFDQKKRCKEGGTGEGSLEIKHPKIAFIPNQLPNYLTSVICYFIGKVNEIQNTKVTTEITAISWSFV